LSDERGSLGAEVEAAWAGFRRWLADRLAGMSEVDEVLEVEVAGSGALWFHLWTEGDIHAEVSAGGEAEAALVAAGWAVPDADVPYFWRHVPSREADRLAVLGVQVLREVCEVAHPAFVVAEGWETGLDSLLDEPVDDDSDDGPDEPPFAFPEGRAALRELVDAAIAPLVDGEVEHDEDGDVPITVGRSTVFVRVASDRPAVDLFAHIVLDIDDHARLGEELNILNRAESDWRFYEANGFVVVQQRVEAWPLIPAQLRAALTEMIDRIDGVARDLAQRVGGRRFHETPSRREAGPRGDGLALAASYAAFLELLGDEELRPAEAALLFEDDRRALVAAIAAVRSGELDTEEHDAETVLLHLGRALRHLLARERPLRRLPPRPGSQQLALLDVPDEQPRLDLDAS
jgi:hypothetical protein